MLEETDLLRTPDLDAYGKAMNLMAETPDTRRYRLQVYRCGWVPQQKKVEC